MLVGVLLVFTAAMFTYGVYDSDQPPLPVVPQVHLEGVDPEVAEDLQQRRAMVLKAPHKAELWGEFGMHLHAQAYTNEAMTCYAAASSLESRNPLWPYLRGIILAQGVNPSAAVPDLRQAANLSRTDSLSRLKLAEILLALDRLDEAAAEIKQVLAANPRDARGLLIRAQLAVASREYAVALKSLQQVPDIPFARRQSSTLLAVVYEGLADSVAAKLERNRLAGLSPDEPWPDVHINQVEQRVVGLIGRLRRAHALMQQQPLQGIQLLRDTVQRYPQSAEAFANLGILLGMIDDYDAAESALQKCLEIAPNNAFHWYILGSVRQNHGQFAAAIIAFRKSIELSSTNPQVYLALGECLQQTGNRDDAAAAFQQARAIEPRMENAKLWIQRNRSRGGEE